MMNIAKTVETIGNSTGKVAYIRLETEKKI